MTHLQLFCQEGQQRDTKRDLAWLGSGYIEGNGGMNLQQFVAQLVAENGEGTRAIMFQEADRHISVTSKGGGNDSLRNTLAIVIGKNKNAILLCDAHTAYCILGPELDPLLLVI